MDKELIEDFCNNKPSVSREKGFDMLHCVSTQLQFASFFCQTGRE